MRYQSKTVVFSKPFAKSSSRVNRSRGNSRSRGIHTYWAEIGFLVLAVLFLQPELFKSFVATISTGSIATTPAK